MFNRSTLLKLVLLCAILCVAFWIRIQSVRSPSSLHSMPLMAISGHSTRLLNFAADGECACDGKEVSAFFDSVVVVAEPEVEVCCDMRADFVANAQRRLVTLGAFLAV